MLKGAISITSVQTELPSQRLKRPEPMSFRYSYREHQKDSTLQLAIEINVREAINQPKEWTYSMLIGQAYVADQA